MKKTMEKVSLKVLFLEDSPRDIEIIREQLIKAGYDLSMDCTAKKKEYTSFLSSNTYDVILSDYKLPGFDAIEALRMATDICPEVPFICISGSIGEETAIEIIKQGAVDYVLKDRLVRLPSAIKRALDEVKEKNARQQAEKALSESERRFQVLAENSPVGIFQTDAKGTTVYVNPRWCQIAELPKKEALGNGWLSAVHDDDKEQLSSGWKKATQAHESSRAEYRFVHKDGTIAWVIGQAIPERNSENDIVGYVGTITDITERKLMEEALRESERQISLVYDTVGDVIYNLKVEKDGNYRFTSVNQCFLTTTGLQANQIIGKRVQEVIPEPSLALELEKYAAAIRKKKIVRWEATTEYPTGRLTGEVSVAPIFDNDMNCISLVGSVHDITERKRAEEKANHLAAIVQSSEDAIIGKTLDGIITSWNKGAEKLYGYTESEAIGRSISLLIPPGCENEVLMILDKIKSGKYIEHYETVRRRKDGREIQISLTISPIHNSEGNVIAASTIGRDITERNQVEKALRESEALLSEAMKIAGLGTWEYDVASDHFTFNNQFYTLFCTTAEREDGYTMSSAHYAQKFVHPDDMAMVGVEIQKALETDNPNYYSRVDHRIIRADGEIGYITVHIRIEKDAQGRTIKTHGVNQDITERKQAEEALAKERNLLRTLIDALPNRIYTKDSERRFTLNNAAHLKALGVKSQEEALGKTDYDFRPKDFADRYSASDQQVLRSGKPIINLEEQSLTASGELGWVLDTKVPLLDAQGKILGIVGHNQDITERKRIEEILAKERNLLRTLIDALPDRIYAKNTERRFTLNNAAHLKALGAKSQEEALGKTDYDFRPKDFADRYAKTDQQVLQTGEPIISLEERSISASGERGWVLSTKVPLRDTQGNIIGLVGNSSDITEVKRVQEALIYERNLLRALMDYVPDQIYFKDTHSRFIRISKAQADKFGISDPGQAVGKTDFNFFTEEYARPAYENEQEIIKTGRPLVNLEEKETWPDGRETWVSTTKLPLRDIDGNIIGTFGISRDITDKKKMQTQLLQTQKIQSIGTLAGGIAHDFNNILGIILAYSSVLERVSDTNPVKLAESLKAINSAVSRGAALVRQILTFARQSDISIKPMSVPELAHEVVSMLQETFPKVIEFKEAFQRGIPLISADHAQIHQAILNLCVNARDAMPKGGIISIGIELCTLEQVVQQFPGATFDRYVCLSVSDTGIGMDEETKSRIFDPFFTTKEIEKGTGLGLSVVYGVIQSHYGFISVDSKVGKGTTFRLYLPVPQEFKKVKEEQGEKVLNATKGTETVLFVEDEELLRMVVASTLTSNGYTVYIAVDGLEAVELYKQHQHEISLVLTDIGLPKQTGVDVFHQLRRINPKLKIILASGFISADQKSELLKTGVNGFLQKPYVLAEVLQKIRGVLDENDNI